MDALPPAAPAALAAPPEDADPSFADLLAARPALSAHALDGLVFEGVPLAAVADALGTPTWVTSAGTLRRRHGLLRDALAAAGLRATIHYATKANGNLAVLRTLAREGAGADVVSGGELRAALAAGIPASGVVFSGVGKTAEEMRLALASGVMQLNVESAEEAEALSAVASSLGATAPVALRVNPDVDARTHAKITTGRAENKFGVALADAPALYARLAALPGLRPVGLAVHIGSQITGGLAAYRDAYARLADLARSLLAAGLPVERLDCGGGLGIPYRDEIAPTPEAFAGAIRAGLGDLATGPRALPVMVEPGRWIAGPAGVLLSRVVLVKRGATRRFVVLDAAMNDLLRPSLYDAWHGIVPAAPHHLSPAAPLAPADVVGPVCESGDTFARARPLPERLAPGDLVALLDAGAYGATMSSTYNARPLAAEAMVDGPRWAETRARQPVEDLLARQSVPPWLLG